MKRTATYTILGILALAWWSTASYGQRIAFSDVRQSNDRQTLELSATVTAEGLDVSNAGGYRLVFSVQDRDTKVILPGIEYLSRLRGTYERRREAIFGADTPAPFEVCLKVRPDEVYVTRYTVSVPYYRWMEGAEFAYTLYGYRSDALTPEESGSICFVGRAAEGPDAELIRSMTEYIAPRTDRIIERGEKLVVNIAFPDGDYMILPSYGANTATLARMETFVDRHFAGQLKASDLYINGYGSPEGKYADNEELLRNRTQALARYIAARGALRGALHGATVHTAWVAEDWDGLIAAINADMNVPQKQALLETIAAGLERDADTREWMIKSMDNGRVYNYLLENIYPSLHRIELEAGYNATEFTDGDICRLALTEPETLGAAGLLRAAETFGDRSAEYASILQTALRLYPDDIAANNNMAVYLMRQGDAKGAYAHLRRVSGDPQTWVNIGVYYYMSGDRTTAREYFTRAAAAGIEKGAANMRMISEKHEL